MPGKKKDEVDALDDLEYQITDYLAKADEKR